MTEAIAGALWAFIAGTVIAALLATIVNAFIRLQRPAASTRCVLWLIVVSICVLAPAVVIGAMSLPSPRSAPHAGVVTAHAGSARSDHGKRAPLLSDKVMLRTLWQRPPLASDTANAIAALWFGGALVGGFGLLRSVLRVRSLKRRSSPLDGSLAGDLPWLTQSPGREIYLRLSYEIETPIAIGFRRPVILIPTEMATLAGLVAIEPLVMHEYAHLARYDDWTNLWQRAIERIAWWNPLVWYAGRRLALEREVAADDAVVHRTHDPAQYASTLWRLAREMRMPEHVAVAPGAMLTRKQISHRIERLLDNSATPHPHAGAALTVAAIAACSITAMAASAPRFDFTRSTAQEANAQLLLTPTLRSVPQMARAIASPARVRPLTMNVSTSSSLPSASRKAADRATIVSPIATATPKRIVQALPSTQPLQAGTPAREGVRREMQGSIHGGCTGCNLQSADLHGQDFGGAYFQGTNMQSADLHGAKLRDVTLIGVNLQDADLDGADLRGAQLVGSNLEGASMRGTLTAGILLTGTSLP